MALNNFRIDEIVKYVRNRAKHAIVIGAIPLTFINGVNLIRTSSDLECGLTQEEIKAEGVKYPLDYYGGALGRHIAFYLIPQNPQRDSRCFENGHYRRIPGGDGFPA